MLTGQRMVHKRTEILVRNSENQLLLHRTTHEFHRDVQEKCCHVFINIKCVSHVLPRLLTVMFAVFVFSDMGPMHDSAH